MASAVSELPARRFPILLLRLLTALSLALLLASCGEEDEVDPEKPVAEIQIEPDEEEEVGAKGLALDQLPGWSEDQLQEALPAITLSCARLLRGDDARVLGPEGLAGTVADWRAPCERFAALAESAPEGREAALRTLLGESFAAVAVVGADGPEGIITGYYEPELRGALAPDETYRWPLYKRPDDLVRADLGKFDEKLKGRTLLGRITEEGELVPYHDRAAIDRGVLAERGLELLWIDDPVDVFFLHIQGSGMVRLPDGATRRVGFASSNGLSYTGIGRVMIDEGLLDRNQGSTQGIKAWLRANPDKAPDVMQRNGRYIFFADTGSEGPFGAQGVKLTAGRSLAVDTGFLPLGVPLWLDTRWPASERPLQRLVVAQDKGAAIKGQVRGDLFWGTGAAALEHAGRMKEPGRYYLILPKAILEKQRPTS